MPKTIAGMLIDVLEQIGVRQIFGVIGDSLNPIGDAVRHSKIEWIGVRHEEGAALAAAGQAKRRGQNQGSGSRRDRRVTTEQNHDVQRMAGLVAA